MHSPSPDKIFFMDHRAFFYLYMYRCENSGNPISRSYPTGLLDTGVLRDSQNKKFPFFSSNSTTQAPAPPDICCEMEIIDFSSEMCLDLDIGWRRSILIFMAWALNCQEEAPDNR